MCAYVSVCTCVCVRVHVCSPCSRVGGLGQGVGRGGAALSQMEPILGTLTSPCTLYVPRLYPRQLFMDRGSGDKDLRGSEQGGRGWEGDDERAPATEPSRPA